MEIKTRRWHSSFFLGLVAFSLLARTVLADPASELASFSVIENVDLAQLASSEVKAVRGAPMSTSRFLSVQSAWVSPGTPAQVSSALQRWSPAGHSELRVLLHANGNNFSKLKQAPNNAAVQSLVSATTSKSPSLQISRAEAAKLPGSEVGSTMSGAVADFWMGVLSSRSAAFASGGSAAQPPYDHSAQGIRPGAELSSLLNEQGKIRKQFAALLGSSGIGRGGASGGDQYWELVDVEGTGVLTLGASYRREAGGGSYQAADVLYYASGGYYVALTLYQMWPVQVNGKPSTLVWRGDMISSPELAGLAGVERLGSESAMIKDVSRVIRVFRRDIEGSR